MSTTTGQVQCMDNARIGWKAALDSAWQQLQTKLPPARRKLWEKSQASWLASRDAEKQLLAAAFATTHGSMYVLAEADMQLQPVRDRALALRAAVADAGSPPPRRPRACNADARCEHAMFDLNRYYHRLQSKMPAHSRPTLVRAQRAWNEYLAAATAVIDERGRIDIIGAETTEHLLRSLASEGQCAAIRANAALRGKTGALHARRHQPALIQSIELVVFSLLRGYGQ
jgi:uncharacterized protein YecT (DUF1311 family)